MKRALLAGLVAVVAAPLLPSSAAAADPVETARREVAAVQAEVDRTAATLTSGTRLLAREQTALDEVQRRLTQAEREATGAQDRADDARARLQVVLAAAYRSPVPNSFALALAGPEQFRDTLRAQGDLQRVRGRQSDLLRAATGERVRAQTAVRTVEQLSAEAARRAREVTAQLTSLQATARQAEQRLSRASGRLSSVQRARAVATVSATCRGGRGGANGFLSASALCPLVGNPGHALRADAAAAFGRMSAARGTPLCVTDSYRSYARQVSVYARKPSLAAVPGTSRHGFGVALDLGCGVQRFGSEAYRWMKANGPRFGWVHPSWAEPGGSMPEPWHWEYVG